MVLMVVVAYWYLRIRTAADIRKRRLILSTVIVFYVLYLGLTRRLIRILYCIHIDDVTDGTSPEDVFDGKYWTEDTDIQCYTGSHGILVVSLVIPMLLMVSIAFPIMTAWVLLKRKRNGTLRDYKSKQTFGFMFRGYKDDYVFWDGIIMLRKAVLALVVGFGYPLGATLQGAISSFVLFVSAQTQLYFSPFSKKFSHLNIVETVSLTITVTTFLAGIFLNDDKLTDGGRIAIAVFVILTIVSFTLFCFGSFSVNLLRIFRLDLEDAGVQFEETDRGIGITTKWLSLKYSNVFSRFT